jgi:hypothetical protein
MYGVTNYFTQRFKDLDKLEVNKRNFEKYKEHLCLVMRAHQSEHWGGRGSSLVYKDGRIVRLAKATIISSEDKNLFFDAHVKKTKNKIKQFTSILAIIRRRSMVSE